MKDYSEKMKAYNRAYYLKNKNRIIEQREKSSRKKQFVFQISSGIKIRFD